MEIKLGTTTLKFKKKSMKKYIQNLIDKGVIEIDINKSFIKDAKDGVLKKESKKIVEDIDLD